MPKTKIKEQKSARPLEEEKIIDIDLEEKIIDPEIAIEEAEEELEEEAVLDDEEVNPFKDRWEE